MEGTSVFRKEGKVFSMKPVGKDELEKALEIEWGKEIRVNPRNLDNISELIPKDRKVSLVAHAGVALNEIQVFDGIPIPRIDWGELPPSFKKNIIFNKDRIPVAFIKAMLEKGSSDKEIRAFFAETQQIISLSQIRAVQEGRSKRQYLSVKKTDKLPKKIKEKSARKRRSATAEVGATSASDVTQNESEIGKLRRLGTRIKNRNSKSSKKVRSK